MYKKLKKWLKTAKKSLNFGHFARDGKFSDPPYTKKYKSDGQEKVIFGFLTKF